MFQAVLFFCFVTLSSPQCVEGTDEYGPYETVEECKARLKEMTEDLIQLMPPRSVRHLRAECYNLHKPFLV